MRIDLNRYICRMLCIHLMIAAFVSMTFAQSTPLKIGPATTSRIESYLDGIEKAGFTGTVLVEHDGKIVVSRAFGMRDLERNIRNDENSVFDIGSLKTPLRTGLAALREAGVRATSVHPMFGPDTELLSGRHVIFIDLGDADALAEAQALFESTMADQLVMGLDEHDRLIAFVLGLSHALNIAFFTALADSGEAAPRLARMSSTTFDAQLDVATRVSGESPELYYEIQSLNAYGGESLGALKSAVDRLVDAVREHDQPRFTEMMRRGHEYLRARQAARGQQQ